MNCSLEQVGIFTRNCEVYNPVILWWPLSFGCIVNLVAPTYLTLSRCGVSVLQAGNGRIYRGDTRHYHLAD